MTKQMKGFKRVLFITDEMLNFEIASDFPDVFAGTEKGLNGINSETKYRLQKYLSKRPRFCSNVDSCHFEHYQICTTKCLKFATKILLTPKRSELKGQ